MALGPHVWDITPEQPHPLLTVARPSPLPEVVSAKEEEVQEVMTAQTAQPESSMFEENDGDDDGDDDGDADSNLVRIWVGGRNGILRAPPVGGSILSPGGGMERGPRSLGLCHRRLVPSIPPPRQSPGSSRSGLAARHRRTGTKSPRMSLRCRQLQWR